MSTTDDPTDRKQLSPAEQQTFQGWLKSWKESEKKTFPTMEEARSLSHEGQQALFDFHKKQYDKRKQDQGRVPSDIEAFLKGLLPLMMELRPLHQAENIELLEALHQNEPVHPVENIHKFVAERFPQMPTSDYDKQAFGLFLPWEENTPASFAKPAAVVYLSLNHVPEHKNDDGKTGAIPTRALPGNIQHMASRAPKALDEYAQQRTPNTAVAYSVCNLVSGDENKPWLPDLRGIPVGTAIIEHAHRALTPEPDERQEQFKDFLPINRVVTLSPLRRPDGDGFERWLSENAQAHAKPADEQDNAPAPLLTPSEMDKLQNIHDYLQATHPDRLPPPYDSSEEYDVSNVASALPFLVTIIKERLLHTSLEEDLAREPETAHKEGAMRKCVTDLIGDLALDYLVRGNRDTVEKFHLGRLGGYIGAVRVLGEGQLSVQKEDVTLSDIVMINYVHGEEGMDQRKADYMAFRKSNGTEGAIAMAGHLATRYASRQDALMDAYGATEQIDSIQITPMDEQLKGSASDAVAQAVVRLP